MICERFVWIFWALHPVIFGLRTPNGGREGDACDRSDNNWYPVVGSRSSFIYCHPKHGIYVRDQCPSTNGTHKEFSPALQQCVTVLNGSSSLSDFMPIPCNKSYDCPNDKWYCSLDTNQCHCKRNFIQINGDCWIKVKINEGECNMDEQCTAVWLTARCINRQCKCPPPLIDIITSTGFICTLPGECPLGGSLPILTGSFGCHIKGECGKNGRLNHLYDCILTSSSVSYCCPNRANTCMQPFIPGNGMSRFLRYYYDSSIDQCVPFIFRGGTQVNTNVFHSRADCNIYCRTGCPRGIPEKLSNGNYKLCDKDIGCGINYKCYKQNPEDTGICCPKPEWICSQSGGKEYSRGQSATEDYDAGYSLHQTISIFYPVIRYYYSVQEHRCKAFLYKGFGGNFNHFLSINHCEEFCIKNSSISVDNIGDKSISKTISCNSDLQCPSGNSCRFGVCWPYYEKSDRSLQNIRLAAALKGGIPVDVELDLTSPTSVTFVTTASALTTTTVFFATTLAPSTIYSDHFPNNFLFNDYRTSVVSSNSRQRSSIHKALTETLEARASPLLSSLALESGFSCPGGRLPQLNSQGNVVLCGYQVDDSGLPPCDAERYYTCAFSSLSSDKGLCCSPIAVEQYRCPVTYKPLVDSNHHIITCSPTRMAECLSQKSICVYDEYYGSYHCCQKLPVEEAFLTVATALVPTTSTTTTTLTTLVRPEPAKDSVPSDRNYVSINDNFIDEELSQENRYGCPPGQSTFDDPLVGGVLECEPLNNATCPPGFKCYRSAQRRRFQCCGVSSFCPLNSAAYISPIRNTAIGCDTKRGCPTSFFCYSSRHNKSPGTCCSEDPVTSLCDYGTALRDVNGKSIKCKRNNSCPVGYNCISRFNISICCPTKERVCSQPPNKGLMCSDIKNQIEYYFDPYTRKCKEFMFSGCNGNDNRFETMRDCLDFCHSGLYCPVGFPLMDKSGSVVNCTITQDCMAGYECMVISGQSYCCPKLEVICSLPKNEGNSCSPYVESVTRVNLWYFSMNANECQQFQYMGCDGNINRFATKEQCSNTCFPALCPIGMPYMVNYELVNCSKELDCPAGYLCMPSRFGRSKTNVCCTRPETMCTKNISENTKDCPVSIYRYRYDSARDRCESVLQSACTPNTNTFENSYDCKRFCVKSYALCPTNKYSKAVAQPWQRALTCSPLFETCPSGYYCSYSTSSTVRICCPIPKCPSGKEPLKDNDGTLIKCNSTTVINDQCPTEYKCQEIYETQYYCCPRPGASDACAPPSRPYIGIYGTPTQCAAQEPRCPEGYSCYDNKIYSDSFCCSENDGPFESIKPFGGLNGNLILNYKQLCLDGTEPLTNLLGIRTCHPNLPYSCPRNYHCQYNRYFDKNQCCQNELYELDKPNSSSICPVGMIMYPHPRTGFPVVCRPNVYGFCPQQSTCEYSTFYWQFICCIKAVDYDELEDSLTSGIHLSETPCFTDRQCPSGTVCIRSVCQCPDGMKILNGRCVYYCPINYHEYSNHCIYTGVNDQQ